MCFAVFSCGGEEDDVLRGGDGAPEAPVPPDPLRAILELLDGDCYGPRDDDQVCPAVVAPVCGCDGETYENGCLAEVAGIRETRDGACPG